MTAYTLGYRSKHGLRGDVYDTLRFCLLLMVFLVSGHSNQVDAQIISSSGTFFVGPPYTVECPVNNAAPSPLCHGPIVSTTGGPGTGVPLLYNYDWPTISGAANGFIAYMSSNTNPSYAGCSPVTSMQQTAGGPPSFEENAVAIVELVGTSCAQNGSYVAIHGAPTSSGANAAQSDGSGNACDGGNGGPGNASGAKGGHGDNESDKDGGCPGGPMAGDPINLATGNKFQQDTDFRSNHWLTFRRFYNSDQTQAPGVLGNQWRHSFERSIAIGGVRNSATGSYFFASVMRPDGKAETFKSNNPGSWSAVGQEVQDDLSETLDANGNTTAFVLFVGATREHETYSPTGQLKSISDPTGQSMTFTYSTSSTPTSVAPVAGLLLTATDPTGRTLGFRYDAKSRLTSTALPDGQSVGYTYDGNNNLIRVSYPGATTRQYVYNESTLVASSSPTAQTGVIDEAGVRFESTAYDSSGRATQSSFADGIDTTSITYNSDGSSTLLTPLGASTTFTFNVATGPAQVASASQPCGVECHQPWKTRTYNSFGYPASYTDFNGYVITTGFDYAGLMYQKVEASGTTSERTTNINWNDRLRVPYNSTVLNASGTAITKKEWVYNASGQVLAECDIDPSVDAAASYTCGSGGLVPASGVRSWAYIYCTAVDKVQCPLIGLLLGVQGPRTDLTQATTYSYYLTSSATGCGTPGAACHQAGDLRQITDSVGNVTTIASYDADGRITRVTDPNGVNTDMTYTPRGWLASRAVGGSTTKFTYSPYGAVASVTDPDGVTTSYTYDAAHRLTKITDALGNYVKYTLDTMGNVTKQQTFDVSGIVRNNLSRSFNVLGQLTAVVDGLNHTVFNAGFSDSYDANGNLVHTADALGIQRKLGYDAINRLITAIDDYNGTDKLAPNTTISKTYDSLDHITQVTDPSGLSTVYNYDGLSDVTSETSPDTGETGRTFDSAGNIVTSTDAKGITVTNTYDALNRLTNVSYPDTSQNITYAYDEANSVTGCGASYPIGRRTRIIENSVTTVYCYDARGNVIVKKQITSAGADTTGYSYTSANRLSGMTYPSGSRVSYAFDGDGRIKAITLTPIRGTAITAVSSASYLPFGPIASYTLGNGQVVTRTYDANYQMTDLTSPAFTLHLARSAMGDVTAVGNTVGASPAAERYTYDPLYRLTAVTEANGTVLHGYTYNAAGDRLSKTGSGLSVGRYSYGAGTHQLTAVGNATRTMDANGNTTAMVQAGETYGFGYNDRNRMTVVQVNRATVANYTYNALGQRVGKSAGHTQRYGYDEASHVLNEYGTGNRDYVWLGDIPVALVDETTSGGSTTSSVAYITADQLGAPRVVSSSSGKTLWQWAYVGNPFGESTPTSSNGYTLNLRLPGQYYDAESGLYNNYFRDYDPTTGRYIQSDPVGLSGGPNTYAYAGSNPLGYNDPTGRFIPEAIVGGAIGFGFGVVNGLISGDYGNGGWAGLGKLATDGAAGAAAGAWIGLTDGMGLVGGTIVRAGLNAATEAAREAITSGIDGCVKLSGRDIAGAIGGSVLGDGLGRAAQGIMADAATSAAHQIVSQDAYNAAGAAVGGAAGGTYTSGYAGMDQAESEH